MAPYQLGPNLRGELKRRLFRRKAFNVGLAFRQIVRKLHAYFGRQYPQATFDLRIIPISSVEWTSEIRAVSGRRVIIFDTEQANALDFICAREIACERPIFHYNEFAVRSSELLFSLGEEESALRMAQVNHTRLKDYSDTHNVYPALPRPAEVHNLRMNLRLNHWTTPSFVLGHEIGHILFSTAAGPVKAYSKIRKLWFDGEKAEDGDHFTSRFVFPSITQKFDDHGLPSGSNFLAIQMFGALDNLQDKIIEESQADFLGLLGTTHTATARSIEPVPLFNRILMILSGMERLLLLRQIVESLPRSAVRGSVYLDGSRAPSRVYMLGRMVTEIASGALDCPAGIEDFWRNAPKLMLAQLSSEAYLDALSSSQLRWQMVARGAMHLGSGGRVPPNMPSKKELIEVYGPLAGTMGAQYEPFRGPYDAYNLHGHTDWHPDHGSDPGLIGFACAVKDLTTVLMHADKIDREFGTDYIESLDRPDTDIPMLIRHPRGIVFRRSLE